MYSYLKYIISSCTNFIIIALTFNNCMQLDDKLFCMAIAIYSLAIYWLNGLQHAYAVEKTYRKLNWVCMDVHVHVCCDAQAKYANYAML